MAQPPKVNDSHWEDDRFLPTVIADWQDLEFLTPSYDVMGNVTVAAGSSATPQTLTAFLLHRAVDEGSTRDAQHTPLDFDMLWERDCYYPRAVVGPAVLAPQ